MRQQVQELGSRMGMSLNPVLFPQAYRNIYSFAHSETKAMYRNPWSKRPNHVDKLYHRKADSLAQYAETLFRNKVEVR